jgi:hypothetical protein
MVWLEGRGTPHAADELALQFDECMAMVPMALRERALSGVQAAAISRLHDRLVALSGLEHGNLWRMDQLASSPEWSNVRRLAQAALQLLRDPPPDG